MRADANTVAINIIFFINCANLLKIFENELTEICIGISSRKSLHLFVQFFPELRKCRSQPVERSVFVCLSYGGYLRKQFLRLGIKHTFDKSLHYIGSCQITGMQHIISVEPVIPEFIQKNFISYFLIFINNIFVLLIFFIFFIFFYLLIFIFDNFIFIIYLFIRIITEQIIIILTYFTIFLLILVIIWFKTIIIFFYIFYTFIFIIYFNRQIIIITFITY